MKFNKKIIVASLSTALGLGIVGSITGTVAWYSYNTRTSTSIVGVSAGNSGAIMFSLDNNNWSNRLMTNDILKVVKDPSSTATTFDFEQVTFGAMGAQNALPGTCYLQPEAGMGAYTNWLPATANKHFLQFNLYIKAMQDKGLGFVKTVENIFLTDVTIDDVDGVNKPISDAVRIHIANVTTGKNYLISKNAVTDLHLYSNTLDLDGNGEIDKNGGKYDWELTPEQKAAACMYGTEGATQTTVGVADVKAGYDSDNNVVDTSGTNPELFKASTVDTADPTNLKLTITMWLEGWHELEASTPIWSYLKTKSAQFHIGLTFDAGANVFDD